MIRKRPILVLIAVLLALAIGGGALWIAQPNPDGSVTITFLGYTNDAVRGRLATLGITNLSNQGILRWAVYHSIIGTSPQGLKVEKPALFDQNPILNPRASEVISVVTSHNLEAIVWARKEPQ